MHDVLKQRAADLARLAARMRTSLDEAESTVPGINEQLAKLAEVGIGNLQFEGPFIGCPPTGVAPGAADAQVVYQAALVMPGGVGAAVWDLHDYHERASRDDDEPVDLAPRFVPYEKCPLLVRARLVHHAGPMLECFMQTMQLLGFYCRSSIAAGRADRPAYSSRRRADGEPEWLPGTPPVFFFVRNNP